MCECVFAKRNLHVRIIFLDLGVGANALDSCEGTLFMHACRRGGGRRIRRCMSALGACEGTSQRSRACRGNSMRLCTCARLLCVSLMPLHVCMRRGGLGALVPILIHERIRLLGSGFWGAPITSKKWFILTRRLGLGHWAIATYSSTCVTLSRQRLCSAHLHACGHSLLGWIC